MINYSAKKYSMRLPRIEEIYPISNLKIKIEMKSPIKSIKLVPDGKVEWDLKKDILELKIPEVNIHSMVIIEKKPAKKRIRNVS